MSDFSLRLDAAIDGKAKPLGALGRIETLAKQIGLLTGSIKPRLGQAMLLVFAGDHGLTAEGVSAYPQDVTAAIAQMVLDGRAGANIAARAVEADFRLADAGLARPLPAHTALIERRIGAGTANSALEPAMTQQQSEAALVAGKAIARDYAAQGYGVFALGEIGIGNSSAAALLAHFITGLPLETLTGPGAGLPPGGLEHKLAVLRRVAARAAPAVVGPEDALREVAGFEMAMLSGALLGAAEAGKLVLIDGFIATACAAAAFQIEPAAEAACVFAHRSAEPGHDAVLKHLGAEPLLDLRMRLGEGTGAALAIPLVRMAEALLCDMADLPGNHPSA